jgi:hypothetical protein
MAVMQSKGASAKKKPQKTAVSAPKAKKSAPPKAKKPTPKRGPGRKPFVPTPQHRQMVEMGVYSGMTHDQIAAVIIDENNGKPICARTLERYFPEELANGTERMISRVRTTMMQVAMNPAHKGCVTAGIWLLKTRAGDREPMPEWQAKRMEIEAIASAKDEAGNETELTFTLKLEEEKPPSIGAEGFDYSQPQKKGPNAA